MIVFDAGTYKGGITLGDLGTYRDGGVRIQGRVENTPENRAHVLLDNVNKVCQVTFSVLGKVHVAQGELTSVATRRNGGVILTFVLDKTHKTGTFLMDNVKKAGDVIVEFSAMAGKSQPSEDEQQPDLGGLGDEEPEDN